MPEAATTPITHIRKLRRHRRRDAEKRLAEQRPKEAVFFSIRPPRAMCIMAKVRRAFAIALLVVFSISLIGPALFTDSESQLPECCRRAGQHHCTMTDSSAQDSTSGPAVKSAGGKCPYYPSGWSVSAHQQALGLAGARTIQIALFAHPSGPVQTEARYRLSFNRSSQKRGPPSFFF